MIDKIQNCDVQYMSAATRKSEGIDSHIYHRKEIGCLCTIVFFKRLGSRGFSDVYNQYLFLFSKHY